VVVQMIACETDGRWLHNFTLLFGNGTVAGLGVCKTLKRTTSRSGSEMTELHLILYRHHLSRTTTLDHRCIIIYWW